MIINLKLLCISHAIERNSSLGSVSYPRRDQPTQSAPEKGRAFPKGNGNTFQIDKQPESGLGAFVVNHTNKWNIM